MDKNNSKKPAIIFDLGGVLIDWNPYYLYCDKLGMTPQDVDRFLKEVAFSEWNKQNDRGRSFAESTVELSAAFPQYRELIHAYDDRYLESIGGAFQPVVELVRKLKKASLPLYVLSNWPTEKFALVRPQYEFFNWFDDMIISGEVGMIKPDHDIFELLLQRIGRSAEECVFIDDHAPNITAAGEIGFQTILFESASQLETELKKMKILDK
jgi:2-haloacid dehalogenase